MELAFGVEAIEDDGVDGDGDDFDDNFDDGADKGPGLEFFVSIVGIEMMFEKSVLTCSRQIRL